MTTREFREKLQECLGGPWPEPCDLNVRHRETIQKEGYRIESLYYHAEPNDVVPALLLVPDGVTPESPAPGIAVWHQHAGQGHLRKSDPAGLVGDSMHHTGVALVKEGYIVLCPDALCFEERADEKLKGRNFEQFEFLRHVVAGRCLAWKNILDMRRAIDLLAARPEVDAGNLGCYGHSMGSTHMWLAGPWEDRLKCLVGNCCLPTYRGIHREKLIHCFPNFVPGLHAFGDTPDMAALIAPRTLHLNFGGQDRGTPIDDVQWSVDRIATAYDKAGATGKFTWFVEKDAGHVLSAAMWRRVKEVFARRLRG